MEEKRCIIKGCQNVIGADRLSVQPRTVTCSPECSARHHWNQVKAAQANARKRKAEAKVKAMA